MADKYTPTETDLALYPKREMRICRTRKCGARFIARPEVAGEDPSKCLPCNRKSWSKLFAHVNKEAGAGTGSGGSVVSIRKGEKR